MKYRRGRPTGAFVVAESYVVGKWAALAECGAEIGHKQSQDWGRLRAALDQVRPMAPLGHDTEANPCRRLRDVVEAALSPAPRHWKYEEMGLLAEGVLTICAQVQAVDKALRAKD